MGRGLRVLLVVPDEGFYLDQVLGVEIGAGSFEHGIHAIPSGGEAASCLPPPPRLCWTTALALTWSALARRPASSITRTACGTMLTSTAAPSRAWPTSCPKTWNSWYWPTHPLVILRNSSAAR